MDIGSFYLILNEFLYFPVTFAALHNISTLYGILSTVKSITFFLNFMLVFFLSLLLLFMFIAASLFVKFSKVVVFCSFNFSNELLVGVDFLLLYTIGLEISSFISLSYHSHQYEFYIVNFSLC